MKKILFGVAMLATVIFAATSCKNNGGNEPDPAKYKVTISNITYNSAHVVIEPADTTVTYFCNIYKKEALDKYGDAAIDSIKVQLAQTIKADNEELKAMYEAYGLEWKDEYALTLSDYLLHNKVEADVALIPSTQFYLAFFEMDSLGTVNSALYKKPFETPAWQASSSLKVDIKVEGSVITWTANNNTETYFCDWVTQADLDYYKCTLEEYADDDINYYGEEIEKYLVKGSTSDDVSNYEAEGYVTKGDKVYAYAFGYKDGARTTEVFSTSFTYGANASAPARHAFQPKKRAKGFVRPDTHKLVVK